MQLPSVTVIKHYRTSTDAGSVVETWPDVTCGQEVTINYSQAFWSQVVDEGQLTCINKLHLGEDKGAFKLLAASHLTLISRKD